MSELQQLRDRVEALEMAMGLRMPKPIDLAMRKLLRADQHRTKAPVKMLGMLLKREVMSVEGMSLAIPDREGFPCSRESLKVYMHRLRRGLEPHGISIESIDRQGWRLTEPNKRKLRALLDQIAAQDGA